MNLRRTRIENRAWLVAVVAGLLSVAPGVSAQQQQQQQQRQQQQQQQRQVQQALPAGDAGVMTANVEVMLLHATNHDGGVYIDPSIGKMDALTKPPFSSYNKYVLLSRTPYAVSSSLPTTTTLPNKRVLQITLGGIPAPNRYTISTSINQPGGAAFMPLLSVTAPAGDQYFVAGQSYLGGMLVIGIKVTK